MPQTLVPMSCNCVEDKKVLDHATVVEEITKQMGYRIAHGVRETVPAHSCYSRLRQAAYST